MMQLELALLDRTTLARRRQIIEVQDRRWPRRRPIDIVIDSTGLKFFDAGEWARARHGETRRSWRKLPLSVDPASHEIVAHELTDGDTSDAAEIAAYRRMAWQKRHGYGKRSLVETAISRLKRINGGRLTSWTFGAQQNEVAIRIKIANRNMFIARPASERVR
jgi:hypothetical protein